MTVFYDNSIREAIELKNRFHSNMKDVQTTIASKNIILERNDDWNTMYFIWLKPKNYWYSWFNKLITGEPIYVKIGQIEINDNSSVNIDVYKNDEVFNDIAQYLDKGNFRVTVVDRTARII